MRILTSDIYTKNKDIHYTPNKRDAWDQKLKGDATRAKNRKKRNRKRN